MAAKKPRKTTPKGAVGPIPVDPKSLNSAFQQKANAMTYAKESRKSNSPSASTRQRTATSAFLQFQGPNARPYYSFEAVEAIKKQGAQAGGALGKKTGGSLPKTKKGSSRKRAM